MWISLTLRHANSKNEIRQRNTERRNTIIIFIIVHFLTGEASAQANTISPREKSSIFQHGYRKCVTHARVFSRALAHGYSNNEIRQTKERNIWKQVKRARKKKSPTVARAYRPPGDRYSSTGWMNYLPDLTYAYNACLPLGGRWTRNNKNVSQAKIGTFSPIAIKIFIYTAITSSIFFRVLNVTVMPKIYELSAEPQLTTISPATVVTVSNACKFATCLHFKCI